MLRRVSTEGCTAAKSSPEVARGGKMDGRSVAYLVLLLLQAQLGSQLRTCSGELALSFKSVVSKIS